MRWTRLAIVPLVLCAVTGCPKKKGDAGDAASDAPVAATDAVPAGPEASNADAVARFPDEAPIDRQAATLQWAANNARKTPQSGDIVATLPKGTNVIQIASHDKFILVTFDDPKNAGQRLMGWVIKDAFSAQAAVRPLPKGTCPAGQTALVGDETFCGKVCKVDADCVAGQACIGTAMIALKDGGAGETVRNCMAIVRPKGTDAGTPPASADAGPAPDSGPAPIPDAGPLAVADAGGGGAPKDAGGGGGSGAGPIIVEPANGACPAGYMLAERLDKKCHKQCKASPDCGGPGVICTRGGYCKSGP